MIKFTKIRINSKLKIGLNVIFALISYTAAQTYLISIKNDILAIIVSILFGLYFLIIQLKDNHSEKPFWKNILNIFYNLGGILVSILAFNYFFKVGQSENQESIKTIAQNVSVLKIATLTCILAPIFEEYIFRYLFFNTPPEKPLINVSNYQSKYLKKNKDVLIFLPRLVVSSVLFAMIHMATTPLSSWSITMVPYMIIGWWLGLTRIQTKSSIHNILLHSLYNSFALAVLLSTL